MCECLCLPSVWRIHFLIMNLWHMCQVEFLVWSFAKNLIQVFDAFCANTTVRMKMEFMFIVSIFERHSFNLQSHDFIRVRIQQMEPDIMEVGATLEEARTLRREHDEILLKLNVSFSNQLKKIPRSYDYFMYLLLFYWMFT